MRSILFTVVATLIAFSISAHNGPQHGGEVDLTASTVEWEGKKVAGKHNGTIAIKSADLNFKNHKLSGGKIVMDMTSITCSDLPQGPGQKLIGHLNSGDFFETEAHPTATLDITGATAGTGNNYTIQGDLTIKGITKPITFDAIVSAKNATAEIMIDRTMYDIKYGSGSFFKGLGDKAINNEFKLNVNLVMK